MTTLRSTTRRARRLCAEDGQTMAEYGVALAVITPAIVLLFAALSGGVTATIRAAVDILGG